MTIGPLMVDIAGLTLSDEDRDVLQHPLVGGVILFARNYEDPAQLAALTSAVHALKTPPLLIAVDQEGGRVQRFRDGFTRLPPLRWIGEAYARDSKWACEVAETAGWIMAAELAGCGVDFSFAPVVDLDMGVSEIIGDRAFSGAPDVVVALARAWASGVRRAGQIIVAKHFPGHGSVAPDSHTAVVRDERDYATLEANDLIPFRRLIAADIEAIMMAHIIYPAVDDQPASLSRRWITGELRKRLNYDGAVFCDDLSMHAVAARGGVTDIARQALTAGCDMLPVCNNRGAVERLLEHGRPYDNPNSRLRLSRLHGRPKMGRDTLQASDEWRQSQSLLSEFMDQPHG